MENDDDLVIALTDDEAESHRADGDEVSGKPGHYYLIIRDYKNLPKFSIRK